MDTTPVTARSLEKPYKINGDDFERAYKDCLSGFRDWKHAVHAQKWLIFPRNIGPNLSIDETALSNGELYTIVSNKDAHGKKGALVAIVLGTCVEDVVTALKRIHLYLREKVREVTLDFSESMHSIVLQCFPYAQITIDRFHMQRLCYEAMQEIRVKHRREALKAEAEGRRAHRLRNKRNAHRRKQGKKDSRGRKPKRLNEAYTPTRLANGDTVCELLVRSHYLLMTSSEKWTERQKVRANILFDLYPDLKEAYSITHSLRMIFNNKNATKESGQESLYKWYERVSAFNNEAFETVASTYCEREDEILNYFVHRATNASAESLNSKIKSFRAQLRGVVDVTFFLFRLANIFG